MDDQMKAEAGASAERRRGKTEVTLYLRCPRTMFVIVLSCFVGSVGIQGIDLYQQTYTPFKKSLIPNPSMEPLTNEEGEIKEVEIEDKENEKSLLY